MGERELSVDALVVGSGNGALTAALCAYELGVRDVLVVEKSPLYGGTSATSGGGIWIPCSRYARAAGAADSYEEALEYVRGSTPSGAVPPELQETYLREGPRMLDFLHERTRVRYESLAHYPDYWSTLPGAEHGHRSRDPICAAPRGASSPAAAPSAPGHRPVSWRSGRTSTSCGACRAAAAPPPRARCAPPARAPVSGVRAWRRAARTSSPGSARATRSAPGCARAGSRASAALPAGRFPAAPGAPRRRGWSRVRTRAPPRSCPWPPPRAHSGCTVSRCRRPRWRWCRHTVGSFRSPARPARRVRRHTAPRSVHRCRTPRPIHRRSARVPHPRCPLARVVIQASVPCRTRGHVAQMNDHEAAHAFRYAVAPLHDGVARCRVRKP